MGALLRWIDVRAGEARSALSVFAVLLAIVAAHTMLETVRDAMFLTHLGSRSLGLMYIVAAGLTLVIGGVSSTLGSLLGARRALVLSLVTAALGVLVFSLLPPTRAMLMSLYAFSAVTGALLIPQFWASIGSLFDAAQSRRLFGTIALAGIMGAVLGSGAASAALLVVRVRMLLPVVAVGFIVAAGVVVSLPRGREESLAPRARERGMRLGATFRAEPILWNLAAIVALGSVTTLLVDYIFKTTAAANVAPHDLGAYFARWSALMNILALLVQLAIARRILDKAGVIGTAGFTPSLLFTGSIVSLVSGGASWAVLGTKIADASLRHSVLRTGLELVYMAVPTAARDRAKPFIDGAIARVSQAAAAALAIGVTTLLGPSTRPLIILALLSAVAWGTATASLRRPYLSLFRRALLGPDGDAPRTPQELDMASLELLVEALGGERPAEVVAAMDALERRGRGGIVPSLILHHDAPEVIERALEIFGGSARRDWVRLAERLITDRREPVRVAALRALARTHSTDASAISLVDEHAWIKGYLATMTAGSEGAASAEAEARLLALVASEEDGRQALLGALTALGDATHGSAARRVLHALVAKADDAIEADVVEAVARASTAVGGDELLEWLVARLGSRAGRAAVRTALVAVGPAALTRLGAALADDATERRVRIQIPRTLQMFESQLAADALLDCLRSGEGGLLRYKALRALGRLVADFEAKVDTPRMRLLARGELVEHARLLGLREALAALSIPDDDAVRDVHALAVRLLDDKAKQSLERAFRAIKLCFPTEDLHRVHDVAMHGDAAARANAAEFLDALLAPQGGPKRQREDGLRQLLRVVIDQLAPAERVSRVSVMTGIAAPPNGPAALERLAGDADPMLAALASTLRGRLSASPASRAGSPVAAKSDERDAPFDPLGELAGSHG